MLDKRAFSRRRFLAAGSALGGLLVGGVPRLSWANDDADQRRKELAADRSKALISITLDMEMSRNFPEWEITHWDFEKGNLNEETKRYTVAACRKVKQAGGVLHTFCVARVLEQENVDWLLSIRDEGHPIGSHTYDHVNVKGKTVEEVQFRFRRAPWLVDGLTPAEIVAKNVDLATKAMKSRLGIFPAGFRTPGGFGNGLDDAPEVQKMLLEQGFTWVSSKYPYHQFSQPGTPPDESIFKSILDMQSQAQPYAYPSGLVEIPISPISDIGAFRGSRWKLDDFLKSIRQGVQWAIDNRATFDFLGHPSCLYVTDPEFKTIDLICELVHAAKDKAVIVDLDTLALRAGSSN